jgi:hypothetical protein
VSNNARSLLARTAERERTAFLDDLQRSQYPERHVVPAATLAPRVPVGPQRCLSIDVDTSRSTTPGALVAAVVSFFTRSKS